jgi:hypothetical protein
LQVDISGPAFINFRADTTFRFLEMNAENQAKASGKASGIDFAKSKFVEAQFAGLLGSSTRTTGVVSEQGQYFPLETDRTLLSGMTVPHTIFDELPAGSLLNWLTAGATSKWSCTRRGEMPVQNVVGEGNNRRLSETLVPISHRVTYHCGEKKGNLQTIHKTFETDSVTTPNGNYVAKGTGTSVFDLSKGLPIKGEMTAEVKQVVRGTPREATVKVTYELRQ